MPAAAIKGVPPWISGPKPGKPVADWAKFVALVLNGTYDKLVPGHKTSEAEVGLGIATPALYWYIGRADVGRGQFLFCWRPSNSGWPEDHRGAVPFDSGGLFRGLIATHSKLSASERRAVFEKYDRLLRGWADEFALYLGTHYSKASDYINGVPPKPGLPEVVCDPSANLPLAWTWEARAARATYASFVKLEGLYITEEDADDFVKWLQEPTNPYERHEILELLLLFTKLVRRRPVAPILAVIVNDELAVQSETGFAL